MAKDEALLAARRRSIKPLENFVVRPANPQRARPHQNPAIGF
jgi:hypothetical protein